MCLREVRQSPSCGAPINGGPSRPALRRMQGSSSRSGVRQQGCDRQYEVLADTFIVKAFSAHQPPAVRYKLPKCSASSANTTPVLRTEGFHIPKVRQTSFLPPCTAHSFGCFQKNGGCIPGDQRSPLRSPSPRSGLRVQSLYLLELIFVLMALTFSAKALSVFIFFSTCWIE